MTQISFTSALKTFFPDLKNEKLDVDSFDQMISAFDKKYIGLSGYLLNEKGEIREHVTVYIDNEAIEFEKLKTMRLEESTQIHIMQAISGG
jgi:hypothetical protein